MERKGAATDVAITGVGVVTAVGQGRRAFEAALKEGRHAFRVMERPGRQKDSAFIGAELPEIKLPAVLSSRVQRTASLSAQAAMVTVHEAWQDANLDCVDPYRIGLVIGGSNCQQRELTRIHDEYAARMRFLRPTYAVSFLDSDLCGWCTEQFNIRGFAYTVGAACASGQLSILQAIQAVRSQQVDVCIAVGALMDLSYWECQALRATGAMGSDRYMERPDLACRPFDCGRDGFIFGECCGAVVVERLSAVGRSRVKPYAVLSGSATVMDAHRNPDPSLAGETRVIENALHGAGLDPREIDYVNPHGTGSWLGDEIEANAILATGLEHAHINATKSIVGHGFSAAGTVEVIATLLQMRSAFLHPSRNLDEPLKPELNWVRKESVARPIRNALNLSIGFGGVNTAICLRNLSIDD